MLVVAVITLLVYLLAYFVSVERSVAMVLQGNKTTTMVSAEFNSDLSRRMFGPAHWLDATLFRKKYWMGIIETKSDGKTNTQYFPMPK